MERLYESFKEERVMPALSLERARRELTVALQEREPRAWLIMSKSMGCSLSRPTVVSRRAYVCKL